MRYGFVVPNNFGVENPSDLIELAIHAETLGFDSVWVNHHVLNVGYVGDRLGTAPYHDALVTLTWMAAHTRTIKLGTSVLVMPYLHPMVLAKQRATLDHLAHGRLVVGLGVGSLPEENAALGVPYDSRGAYSNEFIQVLQALWTEEAATFKGQFFSFESLITSPKPLQRPHPPLVVGGNRPPALRRAGRFADGWHPMNLTPDGVRKRLPSIRAEQAKAGRPPMTTIQVRLEISRVTPETVLDYADAGVTDLVLSLSTGNVADTRAAMDSFQREVIDSADVTDNLGRDTKVFDDCPTLTVVAE